PPQMYNDLQRCDSLKFCPNCQRIIYYWKDTD
ncbi:MAG: nucleotide-binding protein, partial [Desulfobacterales bacterium]|nr:nucleotide-binding protein [Desulfobacterales bacterium]